ILDAAAANQHERVLLQVVADARNVGRDLDAVGEADTGDLAQRGVRLLGRLGEDANAHTALLRAVLQRGTLRLADDLLPSGADKLTDSRHKPAISKCGTRNTECGTLNAGMRSRLRVAFRSPQSAVRVHVVASGLEAPFVTKGWLGA